MQKKEKAQNVIDSFLFHINKSASMLRKQSNVKYSAFKLSI